MADTHTTCIACGQTDDHPVHSVQLRDGTWIDWHMDCHATATDCSVCRHQLDGANGAKGDALRTHLNSKPPTDLTHPDGPQEV